MKVEFGSAAVGIGVAPAEDSNQQNEEDENNQTDAPVATTWFDVSRDENARLLASSIATAPELEGESRQDNEKDDEDKNIE